jgi:sulfatase maturation enzyme AslB (radical SAM superfamily)
LTGNINTIQLILTAQCNSRCSYCYQTAKKNVAMAQNVLRASLELAASSPSKNMWLVFLGGEPLLEFARIQEAVANGGLAVTSEKTYRYKISTNGLLIDDEIAAFLDEHRFEVHLSFDGIREAQDCRTAGSFPLIDCLIERLKRQYPQMFQRRLRICMTVIPEAIRYLSRSYQYLLEKEIRNIIISPSMLPYPEWSLEQIRQLDDEFAQVYETSLRHLEKTGRVPILLLRKRIDAGVPRPSGGLMCGLPAATQVAVDADGQVYGCATLVESYQEFPSDFLGARLAPLRIGDLRDPRFRERLAAFPETTVKAEIFHHKERKYSSYGKCGTCAYLDACSICPVSIGLDPRNTDPDRVPDFFCAFNQVALKYRDRFPAVF